MTLVDTTTAATAAGVRPATIRRWVSIGKLHPATTSPQRFNVWDVLAVRDRRRVDNAE